MENKKSTIKRLWGKISYKEIGKLTGQTADAVRKMGRKIGLPPIRLNKQNNTFSPEIEVRRDIVLERVGNETKQSKAKYKLVAEELKNAQSMIEAYKSVGNCNFHTIKGGGRTVNEVTAVAVLSDIHFAETVKSDDVNGKNEYNLSIARSRVEKFFVSVVKLIKIFKKESKIKTLILALLGDLMKGHLREESLENNSLSPIEEMLELEELLIRGIQYLLDNTTLKLVVPCHSGNHARDTIKIRPSTEAVHSYEYVLYQHLARHFKGNKRIKFIIPTSYHSFIDAGGVILRLHHGHFMKFNGGIGGITISVNKAIAQWNKIQHADVDIFAHFHQFRNGGNFICNGSVIGFNPFAISIKADYEKPKQAFLLIDHKRKEMTVTAPIFLS